MNSNQIQHFKVEKFMNNFNDETIVCVSCVAQNRQNALFCENCGFPLGARATLDPMGAIQAQGDLLHKAVTKRPKFIVLVGIWILFLPWLILTVPIAYNEIANGKDIYDFIFLCGAVALAAVAVRILFVVTKNYLTMPDLRAVKNNTKKGEKNENS